jgi:glycosyltransferase involved in cell wall biosynthesis
MISIIICSKQRFISEQLHSNIESTIGVPYELIVIDNSKNQYSIFEAYNTGVKQAKYNYLCFMHEDIWYHSGDWGKSVINHLSKPETGLIGLAGSYYLLAMPAPWFEARPYVVNMIQSFPNNDKPPIHFSIQENQQVICVDGFWFCSRKDVFNTVSFDSDSYKGFHFYDMDISMQMYTKGYSIWVICDITVEHISMGSQNKQWIDSSFIFYHKWKTKLPASVNPSLKKKSLINVRAYKDLLYIHKNNSYPVSKEMLKIGWETFGLNILTAYLLFYIKLYHC